MIGQISIFSGIPLTYVLFTMTESWSFWAVFGLCFVTALLISWPGKGAKEPMMLGAVPPELRATAFAMTTFIESGFAAIAAYIAGSLADRLGFTRAMLWTIPFPWLICGVALLRVLLRLSQGRGQAPRSRWRARAEAISQGGGD